MSGKLDIDVLVKTIDRAIEQARDLGMPMTIHILMMARIEVDQARRPTDPVQQRDKASQ